MTTVSYQPGSTPTHVSKPVLPKEHEGLTVDKIAELMLLQERTQLAKAEKEAAGQAAMLETCQLLAQEISVYGQTGYLTEIETKPKWRWLAKLFSKHKSWSFSLYSTTVAVTEDAQVQILKTVKPRKRLLSALCLCALASFWAMVYRPASAGPFMVLGIVLLFLIVWLEDSKAYAYTYFKTLTLHELGSVPEEVPKVLARIKSHALQTIAASEALVKSTSINSF